MRDWCVYAFSSLHPLHGEEKMDLISITPFVLVGGDDGGDDDDDECF